MWSRRIDAALDAISSCKRRLPELADLYRADSPEREAIDKAVAAVEHAQRVVFKAHPDPHRGK